MNGKICERKIDESMEEKRWKNLRKNMCLIRTAKEESKNWAKAILEKIIAKKISKDSRISMKSKQNTYKENHTWAHHREKNF